MQQAFVILVVGATSLGAYLVGVRWLRLPSQSLGISVLRMLEFLGVSLVFLMTNLLLGLAVIFIVRSVTGRFFSAYLVNDASLLFLSTFQGILFECWRGKGAA